MNVDGIDFTEWDVEYVKLDLRTCKCIVKVIYHKEKKRVIRKKYHTIDTNCDVNINEVLKSLGLE